MVNLELVKPADLWYIIGLIATDGNLSKDGRHLLIVSKDKSILLSVRKTLCLDNKISRHLGTYNSERKYYRLQFGSISFYRFLENVGLTRKKSLTLGALNIPNKYFPDFLRGVIDGDGSISIWRHKTNNNIQWSMRIYSSAPVFTSWLKNKVEKYFYIRGKVYSRFFNGKSCQFTIKFGKLAAQIILSRCYYDGCLSLGRKNLRAKNCLMAKNKVIKYGEVISSSGGIGIRG